MKKIFTLLFTVFAFATKAQPTWTSANEAAVGLTFNYAYVDSSTASEGSSGANQTWNFSSVVPNGMTHVDQWVTPASTPYAANFPGTNLVQQTQDTAGNTVYLYHNATSSMTDLHGTGFNFNGTPFIMNYSNTEIIRQFPATYNNTLSDNFAGQASITIGPVTVTFFRTGTYSWLVDGYGTLITPAGTFTNTLRAKLHQHITDSIVYSGVILPPQINHNISTSYFWGCTNAGNRLYQFYIGYDTTNTATSTSITKSVSYLGSVTGIEETPPYEQAVATTYPNPANDYACITLKNPVNGIAELSLYDLKGSIVKKISVELKSTDHFQWIFSIADLPAGIYNARITCEDKQWQTRFVKN